MTTPKMDRALMVGPPRMKRPLLGRKPKFWRRTMTHKRGEEGYDRLGKADKTLLCEIES